MSYKTHPSVEKDDLIYILTLLTFLRDSGNNGIQSTYYGAIEQASKLYGGDHDKYKRAMEHLIVDGYVENKTYRTFPSIEVKMLVVNWDLVNSDFSGFFNITED